jgi:enolase
MTTNARSQIAHVEARQILDSRGRPTVEADVILGDGTLGRACAPSGASTGRHEALELRDGNFEVYDGLGVLKAAAHVRGEIADRVVGLDVLDQTAIDDALIELDGTATFSRLGSNATLATSLAAARAAATHSREPLYRYLSRLNGASPMSLPMPMTNILSGGAHAGRGMDLQDFLVIPLGATRYSDALQMISSVRNSAATLMKAQGLTTLLADEGGLSPCFAEAEQALELMLSAFEHARLRAGIDVAIALDVAASELFRNGQYQLPGEQRAFSSDEMADFLIDLVKRFPIVSIEDALDQDDWTTWQRFTGALPDIQVVGDDLFATNVERISQGIQRRVANAALIKLNQNGTLSGTLDAMRTCSAGHYARVVSARSGETEDTFIADFAVGTGAGQIKIGSMRSSERLAKYNQLLRIEEESGLPFAGTSKLGGLRYTTPESIQHLPYTQEPTHGIFARNVKF